MGDLWSIVLAAGESRRMGFPKMLLTFDGVTMIEKVISNISDSKANKILIVLGPEKDAIIQRIGKLPVSYCYNENYKDGMLSSVKCGFKNIPSDAAAVLVFQGDQPLISTKIINYTIEAYRASVHGIVIPVHKKRRGHPLLIDRKYIKEIEKLDPAIGLRSLSEKFSDDVLEVETDDAGILTDFDTFEEYKKGINQL